MSRYNLTQSEEWMKEFVQKEFDALNVSEILVGTLLLAASLVIMLFGARLTKPIVFLAGTSASWYLLFIITSVIADNVPSLTPSASCYVDMIVPAFLAVLVGLLCSVLLISASFALIGFAAGQAVGYFCYSTFIHYANTSVVLGAHDITYWISIFVPAVVGAILMIHYERGLLIIATSILGAVGLVPALAILILSHIDSRFLWVLDLNYGNLRSPFVYGQLLAAVLYMGIGFAFQKHQEEARKRKPPLVLVQPLLNA